MPEHKKSIAIHQPNYLPWPGYFIKMALVDEFIYLDNVQFSKGSYINRATFYAQDDEQKLSVPVDKHAYKKNIKDITLNNAVWLKNHFNKLHAWLKAFPYYRELDQILEFYTVQRVMPLSDLNIALNEEIRSLLSIDTKTCKASDIQANGKGTKLISVLVESKNASTYVAGTGFKNYYDTSDWTCAADIEQLDGLSLIAESKRLNGYSIIQNIAQYGVEAVANEIAMIKENWISFSTHL